MRRQQSLFQGISTGNDRSVSPVIGVILVVAVTVILAAVIGASTLGITDSLTNSPPQADLSVEQGTVSVEDVNTNLIVDYKSVQLTHQSGDDISKENIKVTVNGEPAYATLDPADEFYAFPTNPRQDILTPWDSVDSDSISAGDSTIIILGTNGIQEEGQRPGRNEITFNHLADGTLVTLWETGKDLKKSDNIRLESGDTVRMIWESGDTSTPLVEYDVN